MKQELKDQLIGLGLNEDQIGKLEAVGANEASDMAIFKTFGNVKIYDCTKPNETIERLKERLVYNSETGEFKYKIKPNKNISIDKNPGYISKNGYIYIAIDGKDYLAHRLA